MIALAYLVFIWAPQTRSLGFVFVMCGVLGAASFGLVPVALEFLVEIHYPLGPEVSSSLCWCGGQLLGGVFIVVMDALKDQGGVDDHKGDFPRGNMKRALVFQAVIAVVVAVLPLGLGMFGRRAMVRRRRWEADREGGGRDEGREEEIEGEARGEGEASI